MGERVRLLDHRGCAALRPAAEPVVHAGDDEPGDGQEEHRPAEVDAGARGTVERLEEGVRDASRERPSDGGEHQRGQARVYGGRIDVGAVEVGTAVLPPTGGSNRLMASLGAGLLALGGALHLTGRRKRTA